METTATREAAAEAKVGVARRRQGQSSAASDDDVDDHVGLGGGDDGGYGGDCVLPTQRRGAEYSLKGGRATH